MNSKLRYLPESRDDGYRARHEVVLDAASGFVRVREQTNQDNSVTFHRYHGHELVFQLDGEAMGGCPDADELDELLESPEAKALIARIQDGYESVWDGSNHIAKYSPEIIGDDPSEYGGVAGEFQALIDSCFVLPEGAGRWTASDLLSSVDGSIYGVTAESTDAELEIICKKIVEDADGEYAAVEDYSAMDWLEQEREDLSAEIE